MLVQSQAICSVVMPRLRLVAVCVVAVAAAASASACAVVPCAAPVAGEAECTSRCTCVWNSTAATCGCPTDNRQVPACQAGYPVPSTSHTC